MNQQIVHSQPPARRGVLLLVVLSMLTLFLMLGTAYLVSASRARETARAYSRLTFGGDESRIPHARVADMVLLKVLRGGTVPPTDSAGTPVAFESLLADKYGPNTLQANVAVTGGLPVLTVSATLTNGAVAQPTDLNGRLLTLAIPGRPATSHRILRARLQGSGSNTNASGTAFTLSVDTPRRQGLSTAGVSGRAIINGREFAGEPDPVNPLRNPANEGWDGFDLHNPFLAQVGPGATIASSNVSRVSYFPQLQGGALASALTAATNLIPDGVDNDNDGVRDGLFMDFGIPPVTDMYGNTVDIRASVLIVDLDGRFNVNAHGSLAPLLYSGTHPGWTENTEVSGSLTNVPMGSGYGPAEIAANLATGNDSQSPEDVRTASPRLFDSGTLVGVNTTGSNENPRIMLITGARTSGTGTGVPRQRGERPSQSRYAPGLQTLRLRPLEGKYGWQSPLENGWLSGTNTLSETSSFPWARSGAALADDAASRTSDRRVAFPAFVEPPSPNPPGLSFIELDDTSNYGVPPRWWNASPPSTTTGTNFNWGVSGTRAYVFSTGTTVVIDPLPRGIYNSPPDLQGRMKTLTLAPSSEAVVPSLAFAKPEWSVNAATASREAADDPYEIRLDTRQSFGGWLHDPMTDGFAAGSFSHNPFTPAELEPILRPYDIDTNRLPPRLAAILGSAAEESRLRITTDSWDTTAITGSAAIALFGSGTGGPTGWLQGVLGDLYGTVINGPVSGAIGGEVSRGEKFDLNRSLVASGTENAGYSATSEYVVQRQAYFKDLYTLLVALQPEPAANRVALAQWAANVVEFRDADSRIIPFEYDENPQDGWQDADGDVLTAGAERKVVWGAERPEIVIQEVVAWNNPVATSAAKSGMVISLHRPWRAEAYARESGSNMQIDAEPCDYALDTLENGATGRPTNRIDLGKKADKSVLGTNLAQYDNVTPTHYPIWRLRITNGTETRYLRFDTNSSGNDEIAIPSVTTGEKKPKMGPDSTLTLYSGDVIAVGNAITETTDEPIDVTTHGGQAVPVPGLQDIAPLMTTGTIYVERLSDPSVTLTQAGNVPGKLVGSDDESPTGEMIWKPNDSEIGPAEQARVPVRYVVVDEMPFEVSLTNIQPPASIRCNRRRTTGDTAFWRPTPQMATVSVPETPPPPVPGDLTAGPNDTAWFVWPNRPFVSAAELMLVPQGNSVEILQNYRRLTPSQSGAVGLGRGSPIPLELLFDAVHVPTRFGGIHTTTGTAAAGDLSAHGIYSGTSQSPAATVTANQLSSWREPGRVNLNTVVADDVWNAVVAGPLTSGTTRQAANLAGGPAQSMSAVLALQGGNGGVPVTDPNNTVPGADLNPLQQIYTAIRLANTTTPRSNLFAVWVTLQESVAGDPDSVKERRAFYIVDRSIPVGYEPGRDHNVWDCVRVRRIIE